MCEGFFLWEWGLFLITNAVYLARALMRKYKFDWIVHTNWRLCPLYCAIVCSFVCLRCAVAVAVTVGILFAKRLNPLQLLSVLIFGIATCTLHYMISVCYGALHNGSTSRRLDYASTALGFGGGWRRIVVSAVHQLVAQTVDIVTAAHCLYSIDVAGGGSGVVMRLLMLMRWMLLNMAVHGTG